MWPVCSDVATVSEVKASEAKASKVKASKVKASKVKASEVKTSEVKTSEDKENETIQCETTLSVAGETDGSVKTEPVQVDAVIKVRCCKFVFCHFVSCQFYLYRPCGYKTAEDTRAVSYG